VADARYDPSDLDDHLIDPPPPPEPPAADRVPYIGPERPGDAFNAVRTGGELLQTIGCLMATRDRNGDEHWTRPGKDPRHGSSATVYADDGHTTIYSDTLTAQYPTLELRRPYDPFGLFTHLFHAGDWRASSDTLEQQGYGTKARARDDLSWLGLGSQGDQTATTAPTPPPETDDDPDSAPGSSWRPTALADLVAGVRSGHIDRPTPTVGRFTGRELALYYPGRVNGLYGESGKGKSWIALALAAEVLEAGGTVAWIDLEEPALGVITRLIDLGVDDQAIIERFLHFAPEETIRLGAALFAELDRQPPTLAVVDSTGEALTLEGAGPNNDDEVATWFRSWPRRIATRYSACVIVIDHVVKDQTTRGLFPGGSQRKRAAITGSAFMVDTVRVLGKGAEGVLKLTCAKDRHGAHRQGNKAGEFVLDGTVDPTVWRIVPPADPSAPFRPTTLMERVSRYLVESGDSTTRDILKMVPGNRDGKIAALDILVEEGYVERRQDGQKHLHRSLRAYSDVGEIVA